MKHWLRLSLVAILAAGCSRAGKDAPPSPAASPAPGPPAIDRVTPLPSPIPDVVARVNGEPVPLASVVPFAKPLLAKSTDRAHDLPGALRGALQEYITRELLFQEAQARKLAPDDAQVQAAYDEARLSYRDDAKWRDLLATEGLDPETFRREIRIQETLRLLIGQEEAKVAPVTDEEARAFFDANPGSFGAGDKLRVAHILCRVYEGMTPMAKGLTGARAEGLKFRAKRGDDFAALARQFSDDEMSKQNGGELPEFVHGQTPRAFEDAAYALEKPGDLSDVVEAPDGFHLIKLLERKPAGALSFDQIMRPLKARLAERKRRDALQGLVNELRAKARIETFI